jgi:hypothetical protein
VTLLHHSVAGLIEAVEDAALAIERCIGTVDVLRSAVTEDSPTESDKIAPVIPYREHEASEELVGVAILGITLDEEETFSICELVAVAF